VGYRSDGLSFFSAWYDDRHGMGDWLTADVVTGCVFDPLRADGWLGRATHLSINVGDPVLITSGAHLDDLARTWRKETAAMFTGDLHDPDWQFHVTLSPAEVRITIGFDAEALRTCDVRDLASRWVHRWSALFAERGCHMTIGTVAPVQAEYPHVHPPRSSLRWRLGALDHYFGQTWHRSTPEGSAVLANVESTALPPGAARTTHGDIVRVAYPADLTDAAAVAAARAASERWLVPLVPTEVQRGWNEFGDRIVIPADPQPHDPLTLYDPGPRIGYKAIVVRPDGGVDQEIWAELRHIAVCGTLPDGTAVASIRLIVPVRDNAIAIHERAVADGFEMVTYPRRSGTFWQVNPPIQ
jgi:hypothetical protein